MSGAALEDYIGSIRQAMDGLDGDIAKVVQVLRAVKDSKRRLWVLGNGGSLAVAQHAAQDLAKMCGMRAHALNCPSLFTAHANDDGFEYAYFNQVRNLSDPSDPVLIFSCSGKSRNYIEFVSAFPDNRNPILAIVGTDGGFLREKADISVHVRSYDYQVCETAFCVVADMLVMELKEGEA